MSVQDWDIVVVLHNSESHLRSRWQSTPAGIRDRVIAVDNASDDATPTLADALFGLSTREPNHGLAIGNNRGALLGSSRYLLFCNPDVDVTVEGLAEFEKVLEGGLVDVVGPRLTDPLGHAQPNARGLPHLRAQVLNRLPGRSRVREAYLWPTRLDGLQDVTWLTGAAIAMSRRTFERIGGWPEEYFLYYEDTELCLRAGELGLRVGVDNEVRWVHDWSRDSRRLWSRATAFHLRSALRFYGRRRSLLIHPGGSLALATSGRAR